MNRFVFKQKFWGYVKGGVYQRENIGRKIKYFGEEINQIWFKVSGGNVEAVLDLRDIFEV